MRLAPRARGRDFDGGATNLWPMLTYRHAFLMLIPPSSDVVVVRWAGDDVSRNVMIRGRSCSTEAKTTRPYFGFSVV